MVVWLLAPRLWRSREAPSQDTLFDGSREELGFRANWDKLSHAPKWTMPSHLQ